MNWSTSLVVENGRGEQFVRGPRRTDAIGASLREAFSGGTRLPEDMTRLLRRLDAGTARCR